MSIRKDRIVVVDVEATCWEGFTAPPGQENEILEIGICLLDPHSGAVEKKRSILVKPIESVISPFCTELTSITPELVKVEGTDFQTACEILETEYDTRNRMWASWGSFDRRIFTDQCRRRKVRYPFSKKFSNLKRVFQDHHGERLALAPALQAAGIEASGTAHRGHDDAYNTALLLSYLMQKHGQMILRRFGW